MAIQQLAYDNQPRILVSKETGEPIQFDDEVIVDTEEGRVTVTGGYAPHKPGSTGRVHVRIQTESGGDYHREWFPSVIGAEWRSLEESA